MRSRHPSLCGFASAPTCATRPPSQFTENPCRAPHLVGYKNRRALQSLSSMTGLDRSQRNPDNASLGHAQRLSFSNLSWIRLPRYTFNHSFSRANDDFVRSVHETHHDGNTIPNLTLVLGLRNKRFAVALLHLAFIRCLPIQNASLEHADTCPENSTSHARIELPGSNTVSCTHSAYATIALVVLCISHTLLSIKALAALPPTGDSSGITTNPSTPRNSFIRQFCTSTIDTSCSDFTIRVYTPLMITSFTSFSMIQRC